MSRKAHAAFALVGSYVAFASWYMVGKNAGPGLDWLAFATYATGSIWAIYHFHRAVRP